MRPRIRAAIGRDEATEARDWTELEHLARKGHATVIVIEWLDDAALDRLAFFKARAPQCVAVLVTRHVGENLRPVLGIPVEEVIGFCEIEAVLPTALTRARNRDFCYRLAHGVQRLEAMPPELRAALVHVCRNPQPVRTIARLAMLVGCHRSTLWHQWRRAVGSNCPVRLEDCLDWALLFHAVRRKTRGSRWIHVAAELRISEKTLARLARRLAGLSLRELGAAGFHAIVERFRERVLVPAGYDKLF
ncbi:MAG TPA: hypothetical protein VF158_05395 [Longimicrobiales bacterium]